jgi:uncharacterized protein
MSFLGAALLCVAVVIGWLAQLIGLPGNWVIVVCAAVYAGLIPADAPVAIGWPVVIALAALAVLGELAEMVAAAMGVARVGGGRRSAVLALVGSVIGGLVGIFVGLPIPLVGSLAAAVLFAALGAMAGAFLGESWRGRDFDASFEVGKAAFVGRLFGSLAKMVISSTMVAVTLAALVF